MAEDGADFLDVAGGEGAVLFDGFEEVLRPEFAGKFVVGFVDFLALLVVNFVNGVAESADLLGGFDFHDFFS